MTAFNAPFNQRLDIDPDADNRFVCVEPPVDGLFTTFEKLDDPTATEFAVGDILKATVEGQSNLPNLIYVGSYQGGIVVKLIDGNYSHYILFGDNLPPVRTVFLINNTDPFPVCFVKGTLITTERRIDGPGGR